MSKPETENYIQMSKVFSEYISYSMEKTKSEYCILCGQKKSFCNSHSVPQMVLKTISNNGMLIQPNALFGITGLKKEQGLNKTGTFHCICKNCDSKLFQEYENENNWEEKPSNRMMGEIALKNALHMHYNRKISLEILKKAIEEYDPLHYGFEAEYKEFLELKQLGICDVEEQINFYNILINKKPIDDFQILFWKKLPYITPLATQSMLAIKKDRHNRIINNFESTSPDVRIEFIHICIFPLKTETIVLAFFHNRDTKLQPLLKEFNSATDDVNLIYLNWLIFKYTENYYFAPSIQDTLNSNAKLKELSNEDNERPNLGLVTPYGAWRYTPVGMFDIPNFLSPEYAVN